MDVAMMNSSSILALCRRLPTDLSLKVPVQQPQQLLEQVFHYENIISEKFIVQRLLQVLEQKSNESYRHLQERMHKYDAEQSTGMKSLCAVARREKPLSSSSDSISVVATTPGTGTPGSTSENTYYNGIKQNWAKNLITGINTVLTKIMAFVNGSSNREEFNKIQAEVQRLVAAGTNLTNEDFTLLYSLPKQIFTAMQRAETLTGAQKVGFTNELADQFGNEQTLVQTFADIRIEGFQDILTAIKALLTTEQFEVFLPIEQKLLELSSHMSKFTEQELLEVANAGENFATVIRESELSRNDKIFFCQNISDLYEDQVSALNSFDTVIAGSVYVNQHQGTVFSLVTNFMTSLMGTFAPIDLSTANIDVTSASISGALQTARAINSRFKELTVNQQQLVNSTVESLKRFRIDQYLGAVWAYFVAATVLANKPSATMTEVGQAINAAAEEITGSGFGLAYGMKQAMNQIVTNSGQFTLGTTGTNTYENYTIYSNDNSKVSVNKVLLNFGSTGFLPKVTSWAQNFAETTARSYFQYKALAAVESETIQSQVEELQNEQKQFNSLEQNLYAQQLVAQASEVRAMPLPSAVASVLIDRYMPKEVDFLNSIYGELYYSNLGSSVGNAMIEAIAQYVNGATYFNFASYVGQQPAVGAGSGSGGDNTFPGSQESAQAKLDRERDQAALYLAATQKALTTLQEQKERVLEDNTITNEQRTTILDSLALYQDNLNTISGSLVLLQVYLSPLSVSAGDVAGTFKVTGGQEQWQSRLEILEDALVSGLVGNSINGGMFPLQATIQADQQGFADLGQNFQLELQMHLTSMQQEWTVVATSLQILNQMYLSLARSLIG